MRNEARASYSVEVQDGFVLLTDRGGRRSVTNDAERVVADLGERSLLAGRRILYADTYGRWDELWHRNGRFAGFGPIGARSRAEALERAGRRREPERAAKGPADWGDRER